MPKMQAKISINNKHHISAIDQFTDRTGFIETFWNSMKGLNTDDTKVLVYYGVGGIGKTSLRKKLQYEIDKTDKNILWSSIDFEIKQHREVDNALIFLRTELSKKCKIDFTLFDFAYAYYLKKTSPQIPLDKKSLPFVENGSLIADIIKAFDDVPLLGIPTKIAMLLSKGHKIYKDLTTQKRIQEIVDMSTKEPIELLEWLPLYFAKDLKRYTDTKKRKVVIFLDTYEALCVSSNTDKTFIEADKWIRDVLVPSLPGVLFVILGREKLRWEEIDVGWGQCVEQHIIGALADEDAKKFLVSCGIEDKDIINSIVEISKGHPYSLDLCVDTYEAIKKERMPAKEDFLYNNNKIQIFERLMKYIQITERETLKILSVPRFWDDEIFTILIKKYNTGYPTSAINEFCNFSFISKREVGQTWEMHDLMKKSLKEYQGKEQVSKIHKIMFDHYSNSLKETNNKSEEIYFNEAYYHGRNFLEKEALGIWFLDKSNYFLKIGNVLFLKKLFEEIWQDFKNESDGSELSSLFSKLSYKLGKIYINLGNYKGAKEVLKYAQGKGDKVERVNIISLLAILNKTTYNYKESENYFIKAISNYENIEKDSFNIDNSINKIKLIIEYGKLKVYLSENDEAADIYNKALIDIEDLLKKNNEVYTLLNCKAVVLEKLGEVNSIFGNYEISGELYKKVIEIYNQINNGHELNLEDNSDLIYTLNNNGMVYKRLAEYYVKLGQVEQAKFNYRKALGIYESSIEKFSENVDTYKKIGFAAGGLLRQLVKDSSANEEIILAFDKCLEGFDKAIELSPKDVSAIHSRGGAYTMIGKFYEDELNYNKALEFYDIAVEYSLKASGIQPDYLYAYDGKAKILIYKAGIQTKMGNKEMALKLYKEGLITINEILKRSPEALYAIDKKKTIETKIFELKNI
ncbi:tetratricopeptide repeat protein [Clostridium sp.]|uniref:tetratricopeptide repeat protein n=1 Tax=Clostridium sp. TaxID=1506 RepID=UPI00262814AE|nr:hypothetical protein [uncultured Clostridium sp.]